MRLLQPSPSRSRYSIISEAFSSVSRRLRNDGGWWRLRRGAERPDEKRSHQVLLKDMMRLPRPHPARVQDMFLHQSAIPSRKAASQWRWPELNKEGCRKDGPRTAFHWFGFWAGLSAPLLISRCHRHCERTTPAWFRTSIWTTYMIRRGEWVKQSPGVWKVN